MLKRIAFPAAVLLCLFLCSVSQAGVIGLYDLNSTDSGDIPDGIDIGPDAYGQPLDISFLASGIPGTVTNARVSFDATHTWVGDLRVSLIAPNGKSHLLFAQTGKSDIDLFGSPNDLSGLYRFVDSAVNNWATLAQTDPVPNESARTIVSGDDATTNPPEVTSLDSSFSATAANGRWVLRFEDGASGDLGAVTSATLTLAVAGETHVVSNADDNGAGSLRAAITAANASDQITFDPGFFNIPRTINLLTALPTISKTLAITGPGADLLTVRRTDNAGSFRIFTVEAGSSSVSLSGMTVSNGLDVNEGGGVRSTSNLTLSGMYLTANLAAYGGGLALAGSDGNIINTTFSDNLALNGAGIYINDAGNQVLLANSTISGNGVLGDGAAGILATSSTLASSFSLRVQNSTIAINDGIGIALLTWANEQGAGTIDVYFRNSIVAGNLDGNYQALSNEPNKATFISQGFNLSDDFGDSFTQLASDITGDPKLGPLAMQGGTIPTRLLLQGSAALDAGNSSGAAADQRGMPRTFDIATVDNISAGGDGADIGAVEMQAIFVTNTNDDGAGSLRAAIIAANAGPEFDDILFDADVFTDDQVIGLNSALPELTSMSITGQSAEHVTISRASEDLFRIFEISGSSQVSLTGLAITDGNPGESTEGGGIRNNGKLAATEIVLRNNHALESGGIDNIGILFVMSSTFSGNSSSNDGGGIYNYGGFARVINSTFSGNHCEGDGAAIMNGAFLAGQTSTLEVFNSTFADNFSAGFYGALANKTFYAATEATSILRNSLFSNNSPNSMRAAANGGGGTATISSLGFNLASDDRSTYLDQTSDQNSANANLGPLTDNGGPTQTHALRPGSDAIDAGNIAGYGGLFDQRGFGFHRAVNLSAANATNGDGSDIGAVEAQDEPEDVIFANGFD